MHKHTHTHTDLELCGMVELGLYDLKLNSQLFLVRLYGKTLLPVYLLFHYHLQRQWISNLASKLICCI